MKHLTYSARSSRIRHLGLIRLEFSDEVVWAVAALLNTRDGGNAKVQSTWHLKQGKPGSKIVAMVTNCIDL